MKVRLISLKLLFATIFWCGNPLSVAGSCNDSTIPLQLLTFIQSFANSIAWNLSTKCSKAIASRLLE
jgi:hypothetical protein